MLFEPPNHGILLWQSEKIDKPSQHPPTQAKNTLSASSEPSWAQPPPPIPTLFSGSGSWPQHLRLQWQLILWPPSEFSHLMFHSHGAKASWVCCSFAGTILVFLALQTLIPITAQGNQCHGIYPVGCFLDEMQWFVYRALNSGHHLVSVHLGGLLTLPASQLVIW